MGEEWLGVNLVRVAGAGPDPRVQRRAEAGLLLEWFTVDLSVPDSGTGDELLVVRQVLEYSPPAFPSPAPAAFEKRHPIISVYFPGVRSMLGWMLNRHRCNSISANPFHTPRLRSETTRSSFSKLASCVALLHQMPTPHLSCTALGFNTFLPLHLPDAEKQCASPQSYALNAMNPSLCHPRKVPATASIAEPTS